MARPEVELVFRPLRAGDGAPLVIHDVRVNGERLPCYGVELVADARALAVVKVKLDATRIVTLPFDMEGGTDAQG